MISILRTCYAWEIVQSRDVSYNVAKMGFWTYAEIAIGTIVSCIPVLPKFFQHFGPKIHATFASKPKPGSSSSSNLRQARSLSPPAGKEKPKIAKKSSSSSSFENLFQRGSEGGETRVSETWSKVCHPSTVKVKNEHVTLDEYNTMLLSRGPTAGESARQIAKGTATKRDDLESGYVA